jgi:hypothetical protein
MPKGTQKFRFSFEETHLTHFGGMWLIQRFCKRLKLRWLLQKHMNRLQRTATYHPAELIVALLFAIIMGLRRINKTDILQYNGAFLELLGLERFPDQSTLRRFLKRLPPKTIRQLARLHDSLRAYLFALPHQRNSLVFDVDSTVLIIYGRTEGARVGYNPKKPGRRSYHPLLCFEAGFQEFWHGSLRPGNAGASTGAVPFLRVCLAKAPSTIARSRMRFRMDSGFYGSRVIRFLDASGCGYVMVAREYRNIKARARACRFQALGNGWQVAEFREKVHHKMKRRHRFVVVRRPIPQDPEDSAQLTLFKDRKYAYHVFVTNLVLSPWRVYRFYSLRATIEKNIREFVYDYPLGKIPTDTWTANCQCCFLPTGTFRGRHRALVQAAVFAATVSDDNVGQHPYRLSGAASAIGAREQAQCGQASARLSLPGRVPRGVAHGRSPTVASKFSNLQMRDLWFSSETGQKIPCFAHF